MVCFLTNFLPVSRNETKKIVNYAGSKKPPGEEFFQNPDLVFEIAPVHTIYLFLVKL